MLKSSADAETDTHAASSIKQWRARDQTKTKYNKFLVEDYLEHKLKLIVYLYWIRHFLPDKTSLNRALAYH